MAHRTGRSGKLLLCAALTGFVAACSTPAPAPQAQAAAGSAKLAGAAPAVAERENITGSRIPSKTTDRLLKTIDAAGAKEADRDRAPNPGPKFN